MRTKGYICTYFHIYFRPVPFRILFCFATGSGCGGRVGNSIATVVVQASSWKLSREGLENRNKLLHSRVPQRLLAPLYEIMSGSLRCSSKLCPQTKLFCCLCTIPLISYLQEETSSGGKKGTHRIPPS